MVKIAKKSNPIKLRELKRKIHTETYLNYAITKLAMILSSELIRKNK